MIALSHILAVAAVAFVADRLSKWWVAGTFDLHESRPVLPGIFHLTYVENTGAAFSLLTEQTLLLSILSLLVIAGLVWYAPRVRTVRGRYAFGLVLGGASGNLVDRLHAGAVVDFLDFRVWPVFNLADVAIVCGVLLLAYQLLTEGETVFR